MDRRGRERERERESMGGRRRESYSKRDGGERGRKGVRDEER